MPHPLAHQFERLPSSVIPSHYVLFFKPDLVKCVFEGQVTVDLEVKQSTQRLLLNCVDLEIRHVELHLDDGTLFLPSKVTFAVQCGTVAIFFASEVPAGCCKLSISFKGFLDDSLRGFYRSKYISHDTKEERYCAVTQFEPCFAHRCFPCWDEPSIKATFDISLCVPKNRIALSNMPISQEEELPDGSKLVHFETTPIMSTYLVAMVVGEFDTIEKTTKDDVSIQVHTPVGKQELGVFALDVAARALYFFREFLNLSYPLPKLDLVTVGNFSAGGMENWGLITYRESCLLVDPDNLSAQGVALYVAHELAHQWFGNLVTMEWWTYLWLNEGYATFSEFLCIANLFPEYDIWTQFVAETYSPALKMDALKSSHPIEVVIKHPLEMQEVFDDLSYLKGASIMRMLHRYIGDEDFKKGMNLYLNNFQYGNATSDDLWETLEEASNKPISEMMPRWTRQMGYPVITVRRETEENGCRLFLTQSQFYADGVSNSSNDTKLWTVPIEFISLDSPPQSVSVCMLSSKEEAIFIEGIKPTDCIKLNPGSCGFYRVQYSAEMLQMLQSSILNGSLAPIDRLGLLDDLFALVQAGHCQSVQVLQLLEAMKNETDSTVWSSIASVLYKILKLLQYSDDTQCLFMAFVRGLLEGVSKVISWDATPNESHKTKLLRHVILDLLCAFDHQTTIAEAKNRFDAHLNGSSLSVDIRSTVYRAVLVKADNTLYQTFLKVYHDETLLEEKERISHALASIEDEELLKEVLNFALSDEVMTHTALSILSAIAQSRKGRDLVWSYSKENWDELHGKYGISGILPHFISASFQHFASEQMANELQDFFATKTLSGAERTVQQTIERVRINAAWLTKDLSSMKIFLESFK